MAKYIYFEPINEIFQKFENYEITPCLVVGYSGIGKIIYEACDFDDPDAAIWCVYGHFEIGGRECISDHNTLKEAEEFEKILPILKSQK